MEQIVEYVIFGVLTSCNLGIGLYFAFSRHGGGASRDEMFLASRSLKTFPLAMSVLASMMSALGVVGFVAHYYYHGFHFNWAFLSQLVVLPLIMNVLIPLLYKLRVTSVFEYLRMRFGTRIGLAGCGFYIVMSQSLGAVALYSASVAVSTIFHVPLVPATILMGLTGTAYTALGGLRGVVWTDLMQGILILAAPVTVITKVVYDSHFKERALGSLAHLAWKQYTFETSLDFSNDENVWSCMFGLSIMFLYRQGADQMVVQRYFAAKTLEDAKKIAWMGILLNAIYTFCMSGMALALVYWFQGCDPLLSGAITRFDELLPYYVKEYLWEVPGFSGLFLTGVVCAATSTTSSIINSEAAVFYVDVVSQMVKMTDLQAGRVIKCLAFAFGSFMTVYALVVPHLGSAVRVLMMLYSAVASPFAGTVLLGIGFPWVNSKGAAAGILCAAGLQAWQAAGKFYYSVKPPWMPVSVDSCPVNATGSVLAQVGFPRNQEVPFMYQLSSNWSGLLSVVVIIIIGVTVSLLSGGRQSYTKNIYLTGDAFVNFWVRLGLVPSDVAEFERPFSIGMVKTTPEDISINKETKLSCNT